MCEFKLEELEVFNFRKFENERYKLNPQMNVFAGKNGSGKTAVLEAPALCWGHILRHSRHMYQADLSEIFIRKIVT